MTGSDLGEVEGRDREAAVGREMGADVGSEMVPFPDNGISFMPENSPPVV